MRAFLGLFSKVYYSSILTRNVMICCKLKQLKLLLTAGASHKSYVHVFVCGFVSSSACWKVQICSSYWARTVFNPGCRRGEKIIKGVFPVCCSTCNMRCNMKKCPHLVIHVAGLMCNYVTCSKFTTKPGFPNLFSNLSCLCIVFTWLFFSSLLLWELVKIRDKS